MSLAARLQGIPGFAALLLLFSTVLGLAEAPQPLLNGGFEDGLKGWQSTGDVHLETNNPMDGKAAVLIGPGAGSLIQRIETGSGNHLTLTATIQAPRANGWTLAIRCLDQEGRELMKVDSASEIETSKLNPRKLKHYMKVHPLTRWIEIAFAKDSAKGSVLIDQVGLDMPDENAASQPTSCNLDQAMQPLWKSRRVYAEAVLMLSQKGKLASGQLMFQPTRIIAVQDYGLATNYAVGTDYTLEGRTLVCTPSSRMTQVREEELATGELKWNSLGGKQVMVTYEHEDSWNGPLPTFAGESLPNTFRKLESRAPLTVVAYGDSITHGYGESRLSHIPPFLPPWPELFIHRLQTLYQDNQVKLFNSAQSGADSIWGKEYAARMVSSLNPDLVIVAFGQNDFWRVPASSFAENIAEIIKTVRQRNPHAEFLLVSPMRFDPVYTSKSKYWNLVGEYAARLKAISGPGVQCVDMTTLTESLYAVKKPKDFINDPLHPNDYLARWYAQCLAATLDPAAQWEPVPITKNNAPREPADTHN